MILSNFHTHTNYSDGKENAIEYCKKAIELGFHSLGFSDHAPVPFPNSYSIQDGELQNYFDEVNDLRKQFEEQLNIYLSLEADYIPNASHSFDFFREESQLDYIIGSVHLVNNSENDRLWFIDGGDREVWKKGLQEIFGGDIKKAVRAFYEQTMEMIETQTPEVIGHLDKIKMHNKSEFFNEKDLWYQDLIHETLGLIKKHDSVLEINTRGIYKGRCKELFPTPDIILKAQKMGIPLMLSSDAHHPDEIDGAFPQAIGILKEIGIGELVEFTKQGWKSVAL